jgi:phosphoribosyl 1,2-cyclic phosphodiesterase/anti-anti-sigma regulatory factor
MKIKIWGARGSIPSPLRPEAVEEKIFKAIFGMPQIDTNDADAVWAHIRELHPLLRGTVGGNTTCVEIQAAGQTFIIDAGSGLRELGLHLLKGPCGRGRGRLHFFFSHAHWDHIQGFPFFIPAFIPGNQIFIYSIHDIEQALRRQQEAISFPVLLSRVQADLEFIRLQENHSFQIGQVRIDAIKNHHPGDAYSYRFQDQHSIFVFASDSEYKQLDDPAVKQPHLEFFKNADALIFDAQYTLKDVWQSKEDWGHSSALIGVDLARTVGVKKLLLFHHDPTYSDTQLQEIQVQAIVYQALDTTRPTCEVLVAYEGLTLDLTPPGAVGLRMTPDGEAAILTPTNIFDERGMDRLTQQLARLTEQGFSSNSIIDLSHVETLTTASLKLLAALYQVGQGQPIVLAGPSENVLRIIRVGGYLDFFAIYTSVEAAFAALQGR